MRDFLQAILTPAVGYAELRAIKDHRVSQQFFPLDTPDVYDLISDEAQRFDRQGFDCYYGVLRRKIPNGKAESVVDFAPVLWADIDPYKPPANNGPMPPEYVPYAMTYDEVLLHKVLNFPVPPSVIVDSGHGIHAYWLLSDAMPTADATLAMKGIAKDIGGDNTHDPARVLRLPGLRNHKDASNPMPVRLLRLDTTRRYRSSDFSEYIDKGCPAQNGTPAGWLSVPEARDRLGLPRHRVDLPPWLDDLIVRGVEKGQRSEQCYKAMIWLLRYGWTHNEIMAAFVDNLDGIGAKMAGMSHIQAQRWFDITFKAAETAA